LIALYLDYVLEDEEQIEVQLAVGEPIELVRIPWLFPLRAGEEGASLIGPETVIPHLRRTGIAEHPNERVLLVAPRRVQWYVTFVEAIQRETGRYPLLVQPPVRRQEVGCPGPLRVIDVESYMLEEDAAGVPPWLQESIPGDLDDAD